MKSAKKAPAALPLKPLADELSFLRKNFRDLITNYATQIEAEISQLHVAVTAEANGAKKLPPSRTHDLRDMLMLLRGLELKPAKGRRRDLKKVESVVKELREIADRWE